MPCTTTLSILKPVGGHEELTRLDGGRSGCGNCRQFDGCIRLWRRAAVAFRLSTSHTLLRHAASAHSQAHPVRARFEIDGDVPSQPGEGSTILGLDPADPEHVSLGVVVELLRPKLQILAQKHLTTPDAEDLVGLSCLAARPHPVQNRAQQDRCPIHLRVLVELLSFEPLQALVDRAYLRSLLSEHQNLRCSDQHKATSRRSANAGSPSVAHV